MTGRRHTPDLYDVWRWLVGPPPRQKPRKAAQTSQRFLKKEAAERRARYLLRKHLTPAQNRSLAENQFFTVRGSWSGNHYRIYGRTRRTLGQNVHDTYGYKYGIGLDSPAPFLADWDEHPHPPSDVMLAQKLLIETDERKFLSVACKSKVQYR